MNKPEQTEYTKEVAKAYVDQLIRIGKGFMSSPPSMEDQTEYMQDIQDQAKKLVKDVLKD